MNITKLDLTITVGCTAFLAYIAGALAQQSVDNKNATKYGIKRSDWINLKNLATER